MGRLEDGETFGRGAANRLGIIDPFIPPTTVLNKGERVLLFVEPGTIRSLRHVWEHPDFPDNSEPMIPLEQSRAIMADWGQRQIDRNPMPLVTRGVLDPEAQRRKDSREWIERYAEDFGTDYNGDGVTYDELIEAARDYVKYGSYFCRGGLFEGEWVSEEFWHHWVIVTGESAGANYGENFFSCSC